MRPAATPAHPHTIVFIWTSHLLATGKLDESGKVKHGNVIALSNRRCDSVILIASD